MHAYLFDFLSKLERALPPGEQLHHSIAVKECMVSEAGAWGPRLTLTVWLPRGQWTDILLEENDMCSAASGDLPGDPDTLVTSVLKCLRDSARLAV